MDVYNLNYRQLQVEAKKFKIKANQKIETLRVQVLEEHEKLKDKNSIALSDIDVQNFSLDETDFMADIKENKASTPTNKIQNLSRPHDSSTDDLDKIFDDNDRNSRFFDDVLQLSNQEEDESENNNLFLMGLLSESNNFVTKPSKENEEEKIVFVESQKSNVIIGKKSHNLNETFEMDDNDLQNSIITMDQRKNATSNIQSKSEELFKMPLKSANFISKPNLIKTSYTNVQSKYGLSTAVSKCSNLKRKSQTDTEAPKSQLNTQIAKRPLQVNNNNNNTVSAAKRKSTYTAPKVSPVHVPRINASRPSFVAVKGKITKRQTFALSPSQKPSWKN